VDAIADAYLALLEGTAFILKATGALLLLIVWAAATGLVARDYWNWFVTPLGMAHIGLAHAFGLTMFVTFLRTDFTKERRSAESDRDSPMVGVIASYFGLGLMWGVGWLVVAFGGPF